MSKRERGLHLGERGFRTPRGMRPEVALQAGAQDRGPNPSIQEAKVVGKVQGSSQGL